MSDDCKTSICCGDNGFPDPATHCVEESGFSPYNSDECLLVPEVWISYAGDPCCGVSFEVYYGSQNVGAGGTVTITDVEGSGAPGAVTPDTNGSFTALLNVMNEDTITITATNSCGTATASINPTVHAPSGSLVAEDDVLCPGECTDLIVNLSCLGTDCAYLEDVTHSTPLKTYLTDVVNDAVEVCPHEGHVGPIQYALYIGNSCGGGSIEIDETITVVPDCGLNLTATRATGLSAPGSCDIQFDWSLAAGCASALGHRLAITGPNIHTTVGGVETITALNYSTHTLSGTTWIWLDQDEVYYEPNAGEDFTFTATLYDAGDNVLCSTTATVKPPPILLSWELVDNPGVECASPATAHLHAYVRYCYNGLYITDQDCVEVWQDLTSYPEGNPVQITVTLYQYSLLTLNAFDNDGPIECCNTINAIEVPYEEECTCEQLEGCPPATIIPNLVSLKEDISVEFDEVFYGDCEASGAGTLWERKFQFDVDDCKYYPSPAGTLYATQAAVDAADGPHVDGIVDLRRESCTWTLVFACLGDFRYDKYIPSISPLGVYQKSTIYPPPANWPDELTIIAATTYTPPAGSPCNPND